MIDLEFEESSPKPIPVSEMTIGTFFLGRTNPDALFLKLSRSKTAFIGGKLSDGTSDHFELFVEDKWNGVRDIPEGSKGFPVDVTSITLRRL